jgi:hypothetical protein
MSSLMIDDLQFLFFFFILKENFSKFHTDLTVS